VKMLLSGGRLHMLEQDGHPLHSHGAHHAPLAYMTRHAALAKGLADFGGGGEAGEGDSSGARALAAEPRLATCNARPTGSVVGGEVGNAGGEGEAGEGEEATGEG
jgi:hypothetical protein